MRSQWIRVSLNPKTVALVERAEDTQRPREEGHEAADTEIGVMELQAKRGQRIVQSLEKLGNGQEEFFHRTPRESMMLLNPLFPDF